MSEIKLGSESAFPIFPPTSPEGHASASGYPYPESGLTKRELFAAMAMQGMLANVRVENGAQKVVEASILCADKLLKELAS